VICKQWDVVVVPFPFSNLERNDGLSWFSATAASISAVTRSSPWSQLLAIARGRVMSPSRIIRRPDCACVVSYA